MPDSRIRSPLLQRLRGSSPFIRWYFADLEKLLADFPPDVALAYVFARVELAHNMALYCCAVKKHHVDATLARAAIDATHLTRDEFRNKFCALYGKPIPDQACALIQRAEAVRDRVMHGKRATDSEKRHAIADVLQYAAEFNDAAYAGAQLLPFGDLRGFHGRGTRLPKSASRWILKGMGFSLQ